MINYVSEMNEEKPDAMKSIFFVTIFFAFIWKKWDIYNPIRNDNFSKNIFSPNTNKYLKWHTAHINIGSVKIYISLSSVYQLDFVMYVVPLNNISFFFSNTHHTHHLLAGKIRFIFPLIFQK